MGRRGPPQIDLQQMMPVTPLVRLLMIANAVIWFVGIVILEQYFLPKPYLTLYLGLAPYDLVKHFYLWQPLTYLFIHAINPMHIIFNMLLLWWMGSQLERLWGSRFFGLYYLVCGVGAGFLYSFVAVIYAIATGNSAVLVTPVVGASAALFGCLMAYGMLFGEQVVLFMFFFPMKAKWFVAILGGIEVVLVLNNGPVQGKVANLAHVGGLLTGYIFLKIRPCFTGGKGGKGGFMGRGKKQKTVSFDLSLITKNLMTPRNRSTGINR